MDIRLPLPPFSPTTRLLLITLTATLAAAVLHALVLTRLTSATVEGVIEKEDRLQVGACLRETISERFGENLFTALRREDLREKTGKILLAVMKQHGGFRIKVYDEKGMIQWSDETRLIGRSFPDNHLLARALAGEVVSKIESPARSEHVYEHGAAQYVTETYVPIFSREDRLLGVVEVYRRSDDMVADVGHVRRVVWLGAGVATAALCLILGLIVGVGQRRLLNLRAQVVHQEKMAALGQLSAGIAHEVGNPLSSISAVLQKLLRRCPVEIRSDLNVMGEQVERIHRIVHNVGAFARPSPGKMGAADLNEILAKTLSVATMDRRWKNYHVSVSLFPEPLMIDANADQLIQVFLNIFINAADAMGASGNVEIRSGRRGPDVWAAVADTGPGIPPAIRKDLFKPFVTTKPPGEGTGLGLHVSWNIIAGHGGTITVCGEEGRGAAFTVRLPARRLPAPRPARQAGETGGTS